MLKIQGGGQSKSNKKKSSKKLGSKSKVSKSASSSQKKPFRKETLMDVIHTSLLWETVEQVFFWELVLATDIDFDYLLPVFSKLDSNRNAEATSVMFQLLKTSDPTLDILRHVLLRRVDDNITRALFIHWTITSGDTKMAQLFTKILNKSATTIQQHNQTTAKKIKYNESLSSNNKKLTAEQQLEMMANQKKTTDNNGSKSLKSDSANSNQLGDSVPSLDQVLAHLNKLRLNSNCISFILKENLLETLKKIYKKYCDEETKKKYADLFLLADDCNNNNNSNNSNSDNEKDNDDNEDDDSEIENNGRSKIYKSMKIKLPALEL